jgi:5-methylcytosine-specific restriction endonuclease McrA
MTRFKSLSDRELLSETLRLRRQERETTLQILIHLNEIERRRLHLKLGYSSLFDYCTSRLTYSASAADRRIQTARCMRNHPEVCTLLEQDKVNLTTISLVAPILNESNKHEILQAIRGKSQREVEAVASGYRPPMALRDRVQPVRVQVAVCSENERSSVEVAPTACGQSSPEMSNHSRSGSEESTGYSGGSESAKEHRTAIQQRLLIQFLADEAFVRKYEQARSLLSQRLSDASFAQVFGALMDDFLERNSAIHRKSRRDKKKRVRKTAPAKPRHAEKEHYNKSQSRSRYIPPSVRDEVFVRDRGCCTYVGKTGKRCGSTHALQIDHIVPFARGGPATASNLRLLCAKHNRLAAEEVFGEAIAKRFPAGNSLPFQRE